VSKIKWLSVLEASLLLTVVFMLSACVDSQYRVFSLKEGVQGFSFEYPSGYQLIRLNLLNDASQKYTEVGLSSTSGANFSEIYVYLWPPDSSMSSAALIMDQLLASAAEMKDYSLSSRSSGIMGDTITQQAVFTADSAIDETGQAAVPRPATYRITCMLYGGLAIEMDMTCDQSLSDIAAEDYQHVLDTFAVLD